MSDHLQGSIHYPTIIAFAYILAEKYKIYIVFTLIKTLLDKLKTLYDSSSNNVPN